MAELRVLHTSDLHDSLTSAIAGRLRALKDEHGALLIDTGDAIRAPNVALFAWRERAIRLMSEAGYDAMGLGNREYFFRRAGMAWKTGHARSARLCTNLRARSGDLRGIERWTVLPSPEGVRVGLFALMPTMIQPGHWFEGLSDMRFIPWVEAAREAVAALEGMCDLVVCLFHRPASEVEGLLSACPSVGLVLAGHAHKAPGHLQRLPGGALVSFAPEHALAARLIGLRLPGEEVTMDELVPLRPIAPPEDADP
jgi:2',3'-cyclic-nucleotide 2'-phosphodiesterase (5'-nucleotidase family)